MINYLRYIFLIPFVAACILPAYRNLNSDEHYPGINCLFLGPLAIFDQPHLAAAWSANLFLGLGFFFSTSEKYSYLSWIAGCVAFALSFFSLKIEKLLLNEAGTYGYFKVGEGTYVWMASLVIFTAVAAYSHFSLKA